MPYKHISLLSYRHIITLENSRKNHKKTY